MSRNDSRSGLGSVEDLHRCISEWGGRILNQGYVAEWRPGAIFPREMAYFLGVCDFLRVSRVVESGRQDAYSTMLLGVWASLDSRDVVSIDMEVDARRAQQSRHRLAPFPQLDLRKGDAFDVLGRVLMESTNPTALLIDGPKGKGALALGLAGLGLDHVVIAAQHNVIPGTREHGVLARVTTLPLYYEAFTNSLDSLGWRSLAEAEIQHCAEFEGVRSTAYSSLAVATKRDEPKLAASVGFLFGIRQPPVLRSLWLRGMFGTARRLHYLNERLPVGKQA